MDVLWNITRPGSHDYRLRAWWDVNENGVFDHTTELFIDDRRTLDAGFYTYRYGLGFDPLDFYSRFRLTWLDDPDGLFGGVSRTTDITPFGEFLSADGASHGEVEDYVAEPATVTLFGIGVLAMLGGAWRRRQPDRVAPPLAA